MPTSSLTTKDLIRILPLGDDVKNFLTDRYPQYLSSEDKTKVEDFMWDLYYEYFDIVYEKNLESEMAQKPGPLEPGFQDRVLAKTEEEMSREIEIKLTNTQIEEIRGKIHDLTK